MATTWVRSMSTSLKSSTQNVICISLLSLVQSEAIYPTNITWIKRIFNCQNRSFHTRRCLLSSDKVSRLMYTVSSSAPKLSLKHRSLNQQLMEGHGLIYGSTSAGFTILPIAVRALDKLTSIVEDELKKVDAHKIIMPCMIPSSLWKTSGRLEDAESEIFQLQDRNSKTYLLAPTHEEVVTNLMHFYPKLSVRHLPLRLYQITPKFRDEMRPCLGLLRAREFIMKDLYTFDSSEEFAQKTYEEITHVYERIFQRIGVPTTKVQASVGSIGGKYSHEYHFLCKSGEDQLFICRRCHIGFNAEIIKEKDACPECKSELEEVKGIEVGHAFLLGTKYSEAFEISIDSQNASSKYVQMGCYGLGMTRILAASIEVLSNNNSLRWPLSLCPYLVCIIPPKAGSKVSSAEALSKEFEAALSAIPSLKGNILYDDRTHLSIGNRLKTIAELGIPYITVFGKKAIDDDPRIELHDVYSQKELALSQQEALDFFKNLNIPQ